MILQQLQSLNRRDNAIKTGKTTLDKIIEIFGYAYDSNQNIYYSTMDSWQRNVGFCRLYDEAGAPLSMIMDCEPVHFEYGGEKWLIEFWKGQYGMVTGGEIGVYTGGIDVKILGVYNDTFYNCASDDQLLEMSYTLKKNGSTLFSREGKHWWLTGFKLGEFSEPSELSMDISITLKDEIMRDAFVNGFIAAGYSESEYTVVGNTVSFTFNIPRTKQPTSRTRATDWIIQRKNQLICNLYQELIGPFDSIQDRIKAFEEQAPNMYSSILNLRRTNELSEKWVLIIVISMIILSLQIIELKRRTTPLER